jgi:hypothetical protein
MIETAREGSPRRWISLLAAVVLLTASLAFENLWPTPLVTWRGLLSLELALVVLAFALWASIRGPNRPVRRGFIRALSALWVLLVVGRYGDVTAPALYGRDINLFWDARFMPDVAAMVVRVAPLWLIALVVCAVVLGLLAIYLALRWAIGRIAAAAERRGERSVLVAAASAAVAWFVVQQVGVHIPKYPGFARSVIPTYARQARFAFAGLTTTPPTLPSPAITSDLSLIEGADVLLIFIESYGAITYDRPEFAAPLAAGRAALEQAVRDTNRGVASAFVESTTFGGSSWLAHISLLSGIEVRDHDTNAALMRERRPTLASLFARHGYRTIALMPGLKLPWPEGSFYGFNRSYNAERIDYPGPEFGWFDVPDQYTLAWLDREEIAVSPRAPVFVFFPTLSTHFPFHPTPPYQADWSRMLGDHKFDTPALLKAYGEPLDWVDFGPAYVNAVSYAYAAIGGYLRLRADRDFVMILAGDHQPPAALSGEGAPWDVPVHVITSRKEVLDRLKSRGFAAGLAPPRTPIARIDQLLPVLLHSFGDPE